MAIAYMAVTGEKDHRATVRAVLGDYADLAAVSYGRSVALNLNYLGVYTLPDLDRVMSEGRVPSRVLIPEKRSTP